MRSAICHGGDAERITFMGSDNYQLSIINCRLLDVIQIEFPLVSRPWEALGERLSIPGEEAMSRIARLKSEGIIRQISAIFDSAALGYTSALVAAAVSEARLDIVGEAVANHPSVSHCYARDNHFNLWFTLTGSRAARSQMRSGDAAGRSARSGEVDGPAGASGVQDRRLPAMAGGHDAIEQPRPSTNNGGSHQALTGADRAAVNRPPARSSDSGARHSPALPQKPGSTRTDLLARAASFRESGAMRRCSPRFSGIIARALPLTPWSAGDLTPK